MQHPPDPVTEQRLMAKFERYTATPQQAAHILSQVNHIDVREALASVQAPTLVMHCAGDPIVPVELGRYLADNLPNCERYVEFEGDYHASWRTEVTDEFVDATEQFVTGTITSTPFPPSGCSPRSCSRTSSTPRPAPSTSAIVNGRPCSTVTTACVTTRWIRTAGESSRPPVTAYWPPSTARPAPCNAQRIVGRVQDLGLSLRAGIHVGECELRGDDVSGIAVNIAAR